MHQAACMVKKILRSVLFTQGKIEADDLFLSSLKKKIKRF